MRKRFPYITTFLLTFVFIFTVGGVLFPQVALAERCLVTTPPPPHVIDTTPTDCAAQGGALLDRPIGESTPGKCSAVNPWTCVVNGALLIPGWIAIGILKFATLLAYLSGAVLNFVVRYSLVDMTAFVSGTSVVNDAWTTIRDIANMGFIFILLYAAIKTILGGGSDTKKLIVNVIVVAILINFSLFFTKIVIDISNILAILFYDAIAPGALATGATTGLSYHFMQPLDLQSIFNTAQSGLAGGRLFTIGVMGTILALIVAFVFFAVSIMFVIRIVVLIFVLILSPIAFMAFVLPALKSHADKWKDALLGQAFFAPIYFMLTWIVIVVAQGLLGASGGDLATAISGQTQPDGTITPPDATNIGILVNFMIVIAMLIASLTIAKEWANKAGGAVTGATKWAMGAAGGGVALAGRHTIGRGAAAIADSERLKEIQEKGGARGMAARLTLAAGRKTAGSSLDVRGVGLGIGSSMGAGGAGGRGGFAEFRKKQAEKAEKTAKAMGPSQETIDQAEQEVEKAKREEEKATTDILKVAAQERKTTAQKRLDELKGISHKEVNNRRTSLDIEKDAALKAIPEVKKERELEDKVKEVQKKREDAERNSDVAEVKILDEELKKLEEEKKVVSETTKQVREDIIRKYEEKKDAIVQVDSAGDRRKNAYATRMENSRWAKMRGYNKAAAAQIRKGKSKEKQLAEAYKKIAEDDEPGTPATASVTPPSTPPTT